MPALSCMDEPTSVCFAALHERKYEAMRHVPVGSLMMIWRRSVLSADGRQRGRLSCCVCVSDCVQAYELRRGFLATRPVSRAGVRRSTCECASFSLWALLGAARRPGLSPLNLSLHFAVACWPRRMCTSARVRHQVPRSFNPANVLSVCLFDSPARAPTSRLSWRLCRPLMVT